MIHTDYLHAHSSHGLHPPIKCIPTTLSVTLCLSFEIPTNSSLVYIRIMVAYNSNLQFIQIIRTRQTVRVNYLRIQSQNNVAWILKRKWKVLPCFCYDQERRTVSHLSGSNLRYLAQRKAVSHFKKNFISRVIIYNQPHLHTVTNNECKLWTFFSE